MGKHAVAAGGVLLSLAAISFSFRSDSAEGAARDRSTPEPAVAPDAPGDLGEITCALPAAPKSHSPSDVTCALPAEPPPLRPLTVGAGGHTVFPAPIEIDSKIVAPLLEDIRTFKCNTSTAGAALGRAFSGLTIDELFRERDSVSAVLESELRLSGGAPSRDTAFLAGTRDALAIIAAGGGSRSAFSRTDIEAIVPAVIRTAMNRAGFGEEASKEQKDIAQAARLSGGDPRRFDDLRKFFESAR